MLKKFLALYEFSFFSGPPKVFTWWRSEVKEKKEESMGDWAKHAGENGFAGWFAVPFYRLHFGDFWIVFNRVICRAIFLIFPSTFWWLLNLFLSGWFTVRFEWFFRIFFSFFQVVDLPCSFSGNIVISPYYFWRLLNLLLTLSFAVLFLWFSRIIFWTICWFAVLFLGEYYDFPFNFGDFWIVFWIGWFAVQFPGHISV